ncbi:peptidase M24, structural domain-containing protein, partial [Mycena floridula]
MLSPPWRLASAPRSLANLSRSFSEFGEYSIIRPNSPSVASQSLRVVPPTIKRPPLASKADEKRQRITLGSADELALRHAAKVARDVREFVGGLIQVGVTTNAIDAAVHEYIVSRGAYPSPLAYRGFPKSCCTSVNNIVVHGIPDERPLEDGDIVNVDVTVYLDGFHGDTSNTWLVGSVDEPGRELCGITENALEAGIAVCGPGKPFNAIGRAIHDLLKNLVGTRYSSSQEFMGHGIGKVFHREPWIIHHLNDEPGIMAPGDCFTVEPCIIQGLNHESRLFPDGWTATTASGARSAQKEHMVLITEAGADVLTR